MGLLWIAVVLCFIAVTRYVVYAVKGWWNQREYDRMHEDVETLQAEVAAYYDGLTPGRAEGTINSSAPCILVSNMIQ